MDPRIDVRGRIAELFTSAPRSATVGAADWAVPSAAVRPTHGRIRTVLGGALISAGRALAGDQATPVRTAVRR